MTLSDVAGRPVSRETEARLRQYEGLVRAESPRQNLVAASTMASFWDRHIADSLQLLRFIPVGASLCDIGSGAGLPGIVLAATGQVHATLVEPRRLRAEFLARVIAELGLECQVIPTKAQAVRGAFDVITARAVAPLGHLLAMTRHLSHRRTIWVLPKGRNVQSELESLRRSWHCEIGEEPSVTDPEARIITLSNVKPKVGR